MLPYDTFTLPYIRLECLVRKGGQAGEKGRPSTSTSSHEHFGKLENLDNRKGWKSSTLVVAEQHLFLYRSSERHSEEPLRLPLPSLSSSIINSATAAPTSPLPTPAPDASKGILSLLWGEGVRLAVRTRHEAEWQDLVACLGPVCGRLTPSR